MAAKDLCLQTSMMAGMISPGLYNVSDRWVVISLVFDRWQSNVLIPRETDEPIVKLEDMIDVSWIEPRCRLMRVKFSGLRALVSV